MIYSFVRRIRKRRSGRELPPEELQRATITKRKGKKCFWYKNKSSRRVVAVAVAGQAITDRLDLPRLIPSSSSCR